MENTMCISSRTSMYAQILVCPVSMTIDTLCYVLNHMIVTRIVQKLLCVLPIPYYVFKI